MISNIMKSQLVRSLVITACGAFVVGVALDSWRERKETPTLLWVQQVKSIRKLVNSNIFTHGYEYADLWHRLVLRNAGSTSVSNTRIELTCDGSIKRIIPAGHVEYLAQNGAWVPLQRSGRILNSQERTVRFRVPDLNAGQQVVIRFLVRDSSPEDWSWPEIRIFPQRAALQPGRLPDEDWVTRTSYH